MLRIEDTDMKRNTEEAMAAIYEGLEWLGLNWDEGPHSVAILDRICRASAQNFTSVT